MSQFLEFSRHRIFVRKPLKSCYFPFPWICLGFSLDFHSENNRHGDIDFQFHIMAQQNITMKLVSVVGI